MADRSTRDSQPHRLIAFVAQNRNQIVVDLVVLLVWLGCTTVLYSWFELPQWIHYLVVFLGVAAYAKLTPRWDSVPPGDRHSE